MGSVGSAVKDGAAGAAIGSVAGPEGTAVGAAAGAIYGAITGGGGSSGPTASASNYQLGQGNGTNYSNQVAGALANRGNVDDATATGMQGQAAGAYGAAGAAQGTAAPQITQDDQDRQRMLAALGGTVSQAGALTGAANQLQTMGTNGLPLGVAQAQLKQGQDQSMAQSLAMAHSGRTLGSGASAMNQAQFQNANTNQQTNQQAAVANLQEQQQNQNYKLNALGQAQQGYGAAGNLYGQAGNQAGGINSTDLGVQQTNANLQQTQGGINNQTSATMGSIGQGLNASALGYSQLGQGYQGQALGVMNTQLNANKQYSEDSMGQSNTNRTQANADTATTMGVVGGAAQAYSTLSGTDTSSDKNVKTDIKPANMALSLQPQASSPSVLAAASSFLHNAQANGTAPRAYVMPGAPGSPGNGAPIHYPGGVDPNAAPYGTSAADYNLNAPMPSGTPSHLAPTLAPGMSNALAALGGGQAGGANDGAASPDIPAGWTGQGDPYLAAAAGQGKKYLPGGYWDPTVSPPKVDQTQIIYDPNMAAPDSAHLVGATLDVAPGTNLNGPSSIPGLVATSNYVPVTTPTAHQLPTTYHASDVHSKQKIQSLEAQLAALQPPAQTRSQQYGLAQSMAPYRAANDNSVDTASLDDAYRSQGGTPMTGDPAIDLRPAQGYSYEYKDPAAHGRGRFYGPMAQDLQKTPAGASTVKTGPDGTKMVDTSRLALVNTSAISEQQRKMDELQRQVAALGGAPTPYPNTPSPDTDRIDLYRGMRAGGTY